MIETAVAIELEELYAEPLPPCDSYGWLEHQGRLTAILRPCGRPSVAVVTYACGCGVERNTRCGEHLHMLSKCPVCGEVRTIKGVSR